MQATKSKPGRKQATRRTGKKPPPGAKKTSHHVEALLSEPVDTAAALDPLQLELDEARKRLDHSEKQRLALERKVARLEQAATRSESEPEAPPLPVRGPKSAFRIDLYPRQGQVQGRIEHLLSRDHLVFSGMDMTRIAEFLETHRPGTEPETAEPEAGTGTVEAPPGTGETSPPAKAGVPRVTGAKVLPGRSINHDEPFEVCLTIEIADGSSRKNIQLEYRASIYAKALPDGHHELIAEARDLVRTAGKYAVQVLPNTLEPGAYRLEAAVGFNAVGGEKSPISAFHESGVIQVF